ncbi:hypothetical protein LINPERPRIM_LOCUS41214 [Linum perenne]
MPPPPPPPNSLFLLSPTSPSFKSYSSDSVAARVIQESEQKEAQATCSDEDDEEEEDGGEFEFALVGRESGGNTSPISADEIFYNGQIRPLYPEFFFNGPVSQPLHSNFHSKPPYAEAKPIRGRRPALGMLFREEALDGDRGNSSSSSDELERIPQGTYCVWTPNQSSRAEICKKSNSMGTASKRWKFRDLLYRSNSESSKDAFVFAKKANGSENRDGGCEEVKEKKVLKEGAEEEEGYAQKKSVAKESEKRWTFVPYRRKEMVGLFSNVSRNLHPF